MSKIAFINGSPRAKGSLSSWFIEYLSPSKSDVECVEYNTLKLHRQPDLTSTFDGILDCDALVVVTPLYVDSLPSHLLEFLKKLENYTQSLSNPPTLILYGVLNCGFIEGHQNRIAIRILENYAVRMGWQFGGGIGIGGGEMFKGLKNSVPRQAKIICPIYEALDALSHAVYTSTPLSSSPHFVSPKFPKFAFVCMGSLGWLSSLKPNHTSLRKLFYRPHK
ncbi:MAG: NAD(P)H-dependent oxidoreductase [Cellulosilyticaceae bacterium]